MFGHTIVYVLLKLIFMFKVFLLEQTERNALTCTCHLYRAVCRKHELTQFELEMTSQDLVSKKQQREELATGVIY